MYPIAFFSMLDCGSFGELGFYRNCVLFFSELVYNAVNAERKSVNGRFQRLSNSRLFLFSLKPPEEL